MASHNHDVIENSEARALLQDDLESYAPTASTFVERREARSPTNWIALIRLLDGTELSCNVKDISKSGARLGVPKSYELPDTFMLKVVGRNFVCLVKQAWREGNYVGVRIERVGKLPEPAKAANTATVSSAAEPAEETANAPSGHKAIGSRRSRISSF